MKKILFINCILLVFGVSVFGQKTNADLKQLQKKSVRLFRLLETMRLSRFKIRKNFIWQSNTTKVQPKILPIGRRNGIRKTPRNLENCKLLTNWKMRTLPPFNFNTARRE